LWRKGGREAPLSFLFENKEDLFSFFLKKVKKVDDVAFPQPSFTRKKEKKRLDIRRFNERRNPHKVNARAF
jgi:hypothetical protein